MVYGYYRSVQQVNMFTGTERKIKKVLKEDQIIPSY